MKILILGYGCEDPFKLIGDVTVIGTDEYHNVEGYDLVVFTGGADVTPALYSEEAHPSTFNSEQRDLVEERIYNRCVGLGISMAGICRGSQFLTVMNGGKLVQDIRGHGIGGTHPLIGKTRAEEAFNYRFIDGVTSTHHQMMYPYGLPVEDYVVLATAQSFDGSEGLPQGVTEDDIEETVEAVFYPKTKCLCVQFHPEYMPQDSEGFQYYQNLLNDYIINRNAA